MDFEEPPGADPGVTGCGHYILSPGGRLNTIRIPGIGGIDKRDGLHKHGRPVVAVVMIVKVMLGRGWKLFEPWERIG